MCIVVQAYGCEIQKGSGGVPPWSEYWLITPKQIHKSPMVGKNGNPILGIKAISLITRRRCYAHGGMIHSGKITYGRDVLPVYIHEL